MAGIAETTWFKLQVAHWLSSMRTICIRLHIARYSCLAKFSKTTSLCVDVFFVDFYQNDMNRSSLYQRFGGAVSFDRNIGEASNLKCIILITLFIQISNKNGEKRSQIEN